MARHDLVRVRLGRWLGPGILLLSGCAGEPRILEPRTPPPRQVPSVALPQSAPPAGHGRVIVDTTDGPMRVTAEYDPSFVPPGSQPAVTRTGELCTTPCVADLPVGRYRLFFMATQGESRGDSDDLQVAQGLTFYRRAPGTYTAPSINNEIAPGAIIVLGTVLLVAGTFMSTSRDPGTNGLVVLGAGFAATTAGGIWFYNASRAVQQQGATTIWRETQP